jgi:hypothetical protein
MSSEALEFAKFYSDATPVSLEMHNQCATKGMAMIHLEIAMDEISQSIERLDTEQDRLSSRVRMRQGIIAGLYPLESSSGDILAKEKMKHADIACLMQQRRSNEEYTKVLRRELEETRLIYNSMVKGENGELASLLIEVDRIARIEHATAEDTCGLCLDTISIGSTVIVLPECNHKFHYTPSDACLLIADTKCPMCRSAFVNKF